MGGVMVSELAL